MAKYKLTDFKKGDEVYHLSNISIKMVVIDINIDLNEISCRWLDKNGAIQVLGFMAEELGKSIDLQARFMGL